MVDKVVDAGLSCPGCGSTADEVRDSRKGPGFIRRRRRCLGCERRFTSIEMVFGMAGESFQGKKDPFVEAAAWHRAIVAMSPEHRRIVNDLIRAFGEKAL